MSQPTTPSKPLTDRGLVWAFFLDRKGGGVRVGWEAIATWRPEQGLLWAHFDISEPGPDLWLEERSGLEPPIAAALLAEDTRPRSAPSRNGLLVILRGVNLNPGAEPDDMVSIRVWLERDRIFTTRRRLLQTSGEIRSAIEKGEGPASSGEFLCSLVERLADRIGEAVDELDEQIDAVEEAISDINVLAFRFKLSDLRRQTAHLRRFLAPQRDALDRLVRQPDPILTEHDNLAIREQADRVQRHLEDLDLIRERGMVLQEELLGRMAYEQGQRIFLLSVVAAIFLPLTFLTGLMGMNVGGIPGAQTKSGFLAASALLIGFGVAMALYFRRRRWL
jgi:zinc transporter